MMEIAAAKGWKRALAPRDVVVVLRAGLNYAQIFLSKHGD